jgi:hypothetical protein
MSPYSNVAQPNVAAECRQCRRLQYLTPKLAIQCSQRSQRLQGKKIEKFMISFIYDEIKIYIFTVNKK